MGRVTEKTLLITVSEGSIARNILRSFVLEKISAGQRIKIVLLVPQDKLLLYGKEFGSMKVEVITWQDPGMSNFHKLLSYLSRNGIFTATVLTDQRNRLFLDGEYVRFFIKCLITYGLGWNFLFHSFVRWLASFRKPSAGILEIFRKFSPDIVFSTDVQDEMDLDAIAAARKLSAPVLGMVRSWDNLTSGGLVQALLDTMLVWNPFLYRMATGVQHIDFKILRITGIPHYDWYKHKDLLESRQNFMGSLGLDSNKKLVLFAGVGTFSAPHEAEVAEVLSEAISSGPWKDGAVVFFRPHPNFTSEREHIRALPGFIYDDEVASYAGKGKSSWEMFDVHLKHLINSLYHADLVITIGSTMTIDAIAFDKPVIWTAFDGKSKEPYWNSIKRYFNGYTHCVELAKTHGFKIAYDSADLGKYVNEYLMDPGQDGGGRKKVVEEFIGEFDGHSADRVAEEVLKFLDPAVEKYKI